MPAFDADPHKLRDLSKRLQAAGDELEQLRAQVIRAFQSAGWDDQEGQRFQHSLDADLKTAQRLGQKLRSEYTKTLEQKARALDEYRR